MSLPVPISVRTATCSARTASRSVRPARRLAIAPIASLSLTALTLGVGTGILGGIGMRVAHAQTYGSLTTIATFTGTANGKNPEGGLTLDSNGNLYGTTNLGGSGNIYGTVFSIAAGTNTLTTLVTFTSGANGANPVAGLTLDSSGNLYGTTTTGGGTAFKIAAGTNTLTTLVSFSGANPEGVLTIDSSGNLYGTTYAGGANGDGTVFKIAAGTNTLTTLATFTGTGNGQNPEGSLALDSSGNLYGTTYAGGANGDGTVFKIAAGTNTLTTLATFSGTGNGQNPEGGLTLDSSGNLYGTTYAGGSSNQGTAFKIAAGTNTLTTLVSFSSVNVMGTNPEGGLTLDSSGNLYGTTTIGGGTVVGGMIPNDGTVFKIAAGTNTLTTLASFSGTGNGQNPEGSLALDSSGNLYGTTYAGGANGDGTAFKLAATAYTNTYNGGGKGTASAPVSGYLSTGFAPTVNATTPTLSAAGSTVKLAFGGASYTATDDLVSALTINGLSFTNSGAVTIARSGNLEANQFILAANGSTGAAPSISLGGAGSVTIATDLALNAATTVSGTGSATIGGAISGTGGLAMTGTGTLTLTGGNTNTGAWTISAGTLALAGGLDAQSLTVNSGTTLALSGGVQYTIGGGYGILNATSGSTVTYKNATVNGGTIVGAGTQTIVSGGTTFNNVDVNTTSALTQSGALTMNSGTLQSALTNNAALTMNNVLVTSKGSVTVASGVTDTFSNVEVDGNLTIPNGATVNNTVSSLVLGAGSQTNIGTKTTTGGTLDLGGQTLELNDAFLSNNGTIQNGVVNINYGSTAKGGGNYAGGYNVNYGGKIIFGNSPGTLTSGAATWNGGSSLAFQIDDATGVAGVGWGDSVVNGALALNASSSSKITIALTSLLPTGGDTDFGPLSHFDPTQNYTWDYVMTTDGINGFNASNFFLDTTGFTAYNATNGGTFSISESGNDLHINFNAISSAAAPEPGALALLLGPSVSVVGCAVRRRFIR